MPTSSVSHNLLPVVFPSTVFAYTSDRQVDFAYPKDGSLYSPLARRELEEILPVSPDLLVNVHQVHGAEVVVTNPSIVPTRHQDLMAADAIITNHKRLPIAVRTADCLSIFLYDEKNQAVGIVHAGWKSTQQEIVIKTIAHMHREFRTQPSHLNVLFGPCIRREAYVVGEEFCKSFPYETLRIGEAWHFDNAQANRRQLWEVGVPDKQIYDAEICTMKDDCCFSFRREKENAGRMISIMMLS